MGKRDLNQVQAFCSVKCDVCEGMSNEENNLLLQCKTCKLRVHQACYTVNTSEEEEEENGWECHACKAVSEGREKTRPVECSLCSVDHGIHAMHPLYDTYGEHGRQIVLDGGSKRKQKNAWVHTLCAMYIGSSPPTSGTVYGCDEEGNYDGEEDVSAMNIHHFVICQKVNGQHDQWTRVIEEFRNYKPCNVCGEQDQFSLRIPTQCCFNHQNESERFRKKHYKTDGTETCYESFHVGCARWGHKRDKCSNEYNRVFFSPGNEVDDPETNAFCFQHAQRCCSRKKRKKQTVSEEREKAAFKKGMMIDLEKCYSDNTDEEINEKERKEEKDDLKKIWRHRTKHYYNDEEFNSIWKSTCNTVKKKINEEKDKSA